MRRDHDRHRGEQRGRRSERQRRRAGAGPVCRAECRAAEALPASVVAAVYGRYGWMLWNEPTDDDSITIAHTNTPMTAASCDRTSAPMPAPMAASNAAARMCPAAYLAMVATLTGIRSPRTRNVTQADAAAISQPTNPKHRACAGPAVALAASTRSRRGAAR